MKDFPPIIGSILGIALAYFTTQESRLHGLFIFVGWGLGATAEYLVRGFLDKKDKN